MMKDRLIIFSLLSFILLLSSACKKDAPSGGTLNGDWNLVTYTPSAISPGSSFSYNAGEVVWAFNTSANALDVSIAPQVNFDFIDAGSYNYVFNNQSCGDPGTGLEVNGVNYGSLDQTRVANDSLVLSSACLDGPILIFTR
jgi:hypothetical protein